MQTRTAHIEPTETVAAKSEASRTAPTIPSPFQWLRDLNATFIAYFTFKSLTSEQLRDMGITKRQQDEAFLRQFAPRDDR